MFYMGILHSSDIKEYHDEMEFKSIKLDITLALFLFAYGIRSFLLE